LKEKKRLTIEILTVTTSPTPKFFARSSSYTHPGVPKYYTLYNALIFNSQ